MQQTGADPLKDISSPVPTSQSTPLPEENLPSSTSIETLPGYSPSPYGVDPIPAIPEALPAPDPVLPEIPMPESAVASPELSEPYKLPETPAPAPMVFTPPPPPKLFNQTAPAAVLALENDVEGQMKTGNYNDAVGSLERAIRIQPKNPELWHVLAEVRLRQRQPGLAEDLAKKSNLLAKSNAALIRSNWAIIAECCRMKGDSACVTEAMYKTR